MKRCNISEYHSVECQFKVQYESHLIAALEKLGYKPQIHETARSLEGYRGDSRVQKAHIIIPRAQVGGASNDIGFLRKDDGTYTLHVSAYDQSNWKNKFPDLVKHYTSGVVQNIVQNGPYQWDSEKTDAQGVTTIRLIVRD